MLENQSLFSQNLKKVYKYIEQNEIEKASEEFQQISKAKLTDAEELNIYSLAECLLLSTVNYSKYSPYESLKLFELTKKSIENKVLVEEFLGKYNFSLPKIIEIIYQNILQVAKKQNTEDSYIKALSICNQCFFEQEVVGLKEEAAYSESLISKDVKGYKYFLNAYPTSKHKAEITNLLYELAYQNAKSKMTLESINTYLEEYTSNDNNLIPAAIHLRDSVAFSKINKNYSEYVDFSKNYPKSYILVKINEELPSVLYNQALKERNIELLELFITEFPNEKRLNEAYAQIELITYENIKVKVTYMDFDNFKKRFPNSKYLNELEANIKLDYGVLIDGRDGKNYKTVKIGNKTWMAENIDASTFNNGDPIPQARTVEEWEKAGKSEKPAWCYYNNDPANGKKYGKLYNWFAANDLRGIAPSGWHIVGVSEWLVLSTYIGAEELSWSKMKNTNGWPVNSNCSNIMGFSALPAGVRIDNAFVGIGNTCLFWIFTGKYDPLYFGLDNDHNVGLGSGYRNDGFSIRCVINNELNVPKDYEYGKLIDNRDGKIYKTIKIDIQTWMAENLAYKPNSGNFWAYDKKQENIAKYGYLYNWETAQKVCPNGWHLPSNVEWMTLINYLGGKEIASNKMKSTTEWQFYDNKYGTNESGFNGLPGGYGAWYDLGGFFYLYESAQFWTSTAKDNKKSMTCVLNQDVTIDDCQIEMGNSIRCLKD